MYFYHAYALGVASTIPDKQFTEGTAALSMGGGEASVHCPNFDKHGISFKSIESKVSGSWQSDRGVSVWTTKASVTIRELKILGKVDFGAIHTCICSEYRFGDLEPSTVIAGSAIENLRIDGADVHLQTSNDLSERYTTFGSMQTAFQNTFGKNTVMALLVGRGLNKDTANTRDLRSAYEGYEEQIALPKLKPAVLCSFVTEVKCGGGITAWGPIIPVPDFGNIYLGEVIVWPWMRCLNMFRIELIKNGKHPKGGTISGGSVGTNGTGWPPGSYYPG